MSQLPRTVDDLAEDLGSNDLMVVTRGTWNDIQAAIQCALRGQPLPPELATRLRIVQAAHMQIDDLLGDSDDDSDDNEGPFDDDGVEALRQVLQANWLYRANQMTADDLYDIGRAAKQIWDAIGATQLAGNLSLWLDLYAYATDQCCYHIPADDDQLVALYTQLDT